MGIGIEHITLADGNVFADLGLPNPEERLRKAALAAFIQAAVAKDGLNQRDAADMIGLPQPKLSNILCGRFSGVSEDRLMLCLARLGHDIDLKIKPRHAGVGKVRVLEAA